VDNSSTVPDCWHFKPPAAELRRIPLSGRVDVSHPELGLHSISVGTCTYTGRILCVRRSDDPSDGHQQHQGAPWPFADAYVRGADLVASYAPTDGWPFSPQIYWRVNPSEAAELLSTLSLLVSVQTHLLETWPRISIESDLHSAEVLLVSAQANDGIDSNALSHGNHVFFPTTSAGCILHRPAGSDFSYAEIMPPSDFREMRLSWNADGSCHTAWSLFADFLEKGVIWRARLQSLLLPRGDDVELARACCQAIDQRPLPLTT
jgi:hypothetical protein